MSCFTWLGFHKVFCHVSAASCRLCLKAATAMAAVLDISVLFSKLAFSYLVNKVAGKT